MFDLVPKIGTPLAFVSFLIACMALAYQRKLNHERHLIQTVPTRERGHLVDRTLNGDPLNLDSLTNEQKYDLAVRRLKERSRLSALTALVALLFGALIAAVLIALTFAAAHARAASANAFGDSEAIAAIIQREPQLAAASQEAIRSYFDEDATVRDVWRSQSKVPSQEWQGIAQITKRYQSLDLSVRRRISHRDIVVSKKLDGVCAVATAVGHDSGKKRTNKEIWVLQKRPDGWCIVRFDYDVPPDRYDYFLNAVRKQYGFQ